MTSIAVPVETTRLRAVELIVYIADCQNCGKRITYGFTPGGEWVHNSGKREC